MRVGLSLRFVLLWVLCLGVSGCPSRSKTATRVRPAGGSRVARPVVKPVAPQVRFVVDELWLAVFMVAYHHKLYRRLGIGKAPKSRWKSWKKRKKGWLPAGTYRALKLKYFTNDTKDALTFIQKAKAISKQKFHILRGSYSIGPLSKRWDFRSPATTTEASLRAYHPDMPGYVKQLRGLKEFQTIVAQTRKRKTFCVNQWKRNLARSTRIMTELTGISFKRCVTVYLGYPGMSGGRYLGRSGPKECPYAIMWGGREEFPEYTTVYVWHELLHSYIPNGPLEHAAIQLLTDNELRVRLSKHAKAYPPFVGHFRSMPWMVMLGPEWRRYLRQKGQRDIRSFMKRIRRKYRIRYPSRSRSIGPSCRKSGPRLHPAAVRRSQPRS